MHRDKYIFDIKKPTMLSSILLLLAFVAVTVAFAPLSNKVTRQSAINAIPSFNWPGSKMPASNLESLFGGGGSSSVKSSPAPAASKGKAPAAKAGSKAAPKSGKKDMRWGGRPDPTPELNIVKEESFFSADWRFNKK